MLKGADKTNKQTNLKTKPTDLSRQKTSKDADKQDRIFADHQSSMPNTKLIYHN